MRGPSNRFLWIYIGLVTFSCVGEAFSIRQGLNPGLIAPVAGATTLLFGLGLCVWSYLGAWWPLWTVWGVGALVEVVGITTGLPFGRYGYSDRWAPVVHVSGYAFPLLVPFAWLLAILSSFLVVSVYAAGASRIALTGALAVTLDLVMEPAMTRRGYWHWAKPTSLPGGAPWQNFAAWFVLACLGAWVLSFGRRSEDYQGRAASVVWIGQVWLMACLWMA